MAQAVIFAVIVVLLALGGVIVFWTTPKLRAMAATDKAFMDRYAKRSNEIAALPFDEAQRQAELLLADPTAFSCAPALAPLEIGGALAPSLRLLFSRFESIRSVRSEATLERELIAPFGWNWEEGPWRRHQVWQIGASHEHGLILVKPHREGIYDTDGMEPDDLEEPDSQSVYHWLLMVASDFTPTA